MLKDLKNDKIPTEFTFPLAQVNALKIFSQLGVCTEFGRQLVSSNVPTFLGSEVSINFTLFSHWSIWIKVRVFPVPFCGLTTCNLNTGCLTFVTHSAEDAVISSAHLPSLNDSGSFHTVEILNLRVRFSAELVPLFPLCRFLQNAQKTDTWRGFLTYSISIKFSSFLQI